VSRPHRSGFEGTCNLHIAGVGRRYNNSCVRKFAVNGIERVEAVPFRHLQVHQRDIRVMHLELLDGPRARWMLRTISG